MRADNTPMKSHRRRRGAGFTLIELMIVLAILAAIAGLVVVVVDGIGSKASGDTTQASLAEIRSAIMGSAGKSGYYADVVALPPTMTALFKQGSLPAYDPVTRIGWNGPYLKAASGIYTVDAATGFFDHLGSNGDPAILDGWGKPVVLQVPDADGDFVLTPPDANERKHSRLVSAGPDGVIQTPLTPAATLAPGTYLLPSRAQCEDDLVLYLRVTDTRP